MTRWRAGQKQAENLTYSESPNGSLVVVAVESSCASNAKGPPAAWQFRKRINFSKKECKSHFFVSVMRQKQSASFLEAETFNMRIWVKRFHEDVATSKPPFFAAAVLCSAHAHSSWTSITRWTQGMKAVHSISLKPGWGSRGKQSGLRLFQASESRWRQEWWMINDIWWRQTVSRL